ncbi:TetR family transcriptional regulator [soil metagenome]
MTTLGDEGLRERRKRATRRSLEDAALRLFARDGFDATSIETIAAAADVSPRTFFRYFATKDEVLTPDREERQARLRAEVRALAGSGPDALETVARALASIAADFEAEREILLLRRLAARTSPVLRGRLHDVVRSWQHTLTRALVEDAGVPTLEAEVAAEAGIALWQGAISRWLADEGPERDLTAHLRASFAALRL